MKEARDHITEWYELFYIGNDEEAVQPGEKYSVIYVDKIDTKAVQPHAENSIFKTKYLATRSAQWKAKGSVIKGKELHIRDDASVKR